METDLETDLEMDLRAIPEPDPEIDLNPGINGLLAAGNPGKQTPLWPVHAAGFVLSRWEK